MKQTGENGGQDKERFGKEVTEKAAKQMAEGIEGRESKVGTGKCM